MRVSWVSHANAFTSNRWNSDTRPAVHSVWCRFMASMPISDRSCACRSSGTSIVWRRVECTSLTAGSSRSVRSSTGAGCRPRGVRARRSAGRPRAAPGPPPSPSRRPRGRNPSPARRTRRRAGARPPSPAGRRCSPAIAVPAQPAAHDGSCTHTTSPSALSQTSVSRAPVPAASARRKAGSVFSGSSRRAPRWAKVITAKRHASLPRGSIRRRRWDQGRGPGALKRPRRAAEG